VVGKHEGGSLIWLCRCDCGGEIAVRSNRLVHCNTRTCGCARKRPTGRAPWNVGMTYAFKADNENYKSKAAWVEAAIRRFGNKCQACGWDKAKCDVHHIIHRQHGGKNTLSNAKVLCPNCHREHHEAERAA